VKRVTASEARKNWFRLLDEVAAGEVVVIERSGRRLVLRRDPKAVPASAQTVPDYSKLLRVPDEEAADQWGWEWKGPGRLVPKSVRKP